MADPVVGKLGSAVIQGTLAEGNVAVEKQGPSKFDAVQAEAAATKMEAAELPTLVEQVPETEKQQLVSDVRQRMESHPASVPQQVYAPEMTQQSARLESVRTRVAALPREDLRVAFTARLDQIDRQFRQAGGMLEKITTMNDPRALLQLQMQLYQVSQNVEMVSKAVEQVNSGVKQVLQTQV
ncbi:MAG: hypothetical protein MUF01_09590 [Bryobacterales bacterium]|jgi:hypothetical protein|nr:hypothetical protein [Bryobacterales bacterium]